MSVRSPERQETKARQTPRSLIANRGIGGCGSASFMVTVHFVTVGRDMSRPSTPTNESVTMSKQSLAEVLNQVMVWDKGHRVAGYDPAVWRQDDFGRWICRHNYGDRDSDFGWEIDHIRPSSLLGHSGIENLRPLHHANNSSLGGLLGSLMAKY